MQSNQINYRNWSFFEFLIQEILKPEAQIEGL